MLRCPDQSVRAIGIGRHGVPRTMNQSPSPLRPIQSKRAPSPVVFSSDLWRLHHLVPDRHLDLNPGVAQVLVGGAVYPDHHLVAAGHELWQGPGPAELDQLRGLAGRTVEDLDRVPALAIHGQDEGCAAGWGCATGGNGDFVVVGLGQDNPCCISLEKDMCYSWALDCTSENLLMLKRNLWSWFLSKSITINTYKFCSFKWGSFLPLYFTERESFSFSSFQL